MTVGVMRKKFPIVDEKEWTVARALEEIDSVEKWARQMGYTNIAPRLAWAIQVIKSSAKP